ncbi:MAG: hypothetical protein ACE5G0_10760 [Rhodothermales bacterium]
MNRLLRTVTAGVCLALLLGSGSPVAAQTVHKLTIRDGKVWINDVSVQQADLPASLDIQGIDATYTFIGDATPMIELGGVLYTLKDQHLREVADLREEQGGVTVYFRDRIGTGGVAPRVVNKRGNDVAAVSLTEQQAQKLHLQKQALEQLSRQVEQRAADQLLEQARVAGDIADALPRLEVENYFNSVQQYNQNLYELLVQEWQMERDAQILAWQIQRLPEGEVREQRIADLREKLDDIFEYKQQNRRLEIQQLEQQLAQLNQRLVKREQWRDRLIEQRLNEIIGKQRPPDNR